MHVQWHSSRAEGRSRVVAGPRQERSECPLGKDCGAGPAHARGPGARVAAAT